MHSDDNDNLLLHLHGRKSVVIVEPEASAAHMDVVRALFTRAGTHAAIYGDGDDGVPLPRLQCMLEPGDALYIPFGWYHDVESQSATVSAALRFEASALAPEHMLASAMDL